MVRGPASPSLESAFACVVRQSVSTVPPNKQILFAWSVKPKNYPGSHWQGSSTSFFIPGFNLYPPNVFYLCLRSWTSQPCILRGPFSSGLQFYNEHCEVQRRGSCILTLRWEKSLGRRVHGKEHRRVEFLPEAARRDRYFRRALYFENLCF